MFVDIIRKVIDMWVKILKHVGLLLVSLIIAQMLMFYIFDDLIVNVTASPIVFISGRLILAVLFWILLFFSTSSKKQRKLLVSGKLVFFIYAIYTLFLIAITLLKGNVVVDSPYNFIPFKSILGFSEVNGSIKALNIVANLLMFLPLGIILCFGNKKGFNSLLTVTYTSLGIELFQFIFKKGIFDIDDIILNTLGGLLGILLFKYFLSPLSNKFIEMKS
jgi:glycopeptide antibiotics resistance protein